MQGGGVLTGGSGGVLSTFSVCEWHGVCVCVYVCVLLRVQAFVSFVTTSQQLLSLANPRS